MNALCCFQLYLILQFLTIQITGMALLFFFLFFFYLTYLTPSCRESTAENMNNLQIINKTLPPLLLLLTVDPAEHHHILKNVGNVTQRISLFNLILKPVFLRKQSKCDHAACVSVSPFSLLSLGLHLKNLTKK